MAKSKKIPARKTHLSKWCARSRYLIVLPDQGAPKAVSLQQLGIEGRDRSWNSNVDNFLRANQTSFDALKLDIQYSSNPNEIEVKLKANGIIGTVPLRAPNTHKVIGGVIVKPRYGWNSVGNMFSSIGWSASPEILDCPMIPGSATEIPAWVIAGPALVRLEALLRNCVPRFVEKTEMRTSPRGQILWNEYCTTQIPRGNFHHLPCSFSDLDSNHQLRRYIKWSLEKIANELSVFYSSDFFARALFERAQTLLNELASVSSLLPEHRQLDSMERALRLQSNGSVGIRVDAIRWILDERGLGGTFDFDGLPWRIPMHDLFERWVEFLVRRWAKNFGGRVTSGSKFDSRSSVNWQRSSVKSLDSLIPDVVVETGNHVIIFDAKYKGFLEEVDELRWRDSLTQRVEEHRHDFHQVLAYASLYDSEHLTAVLVYPIPLREQNGEEPFCKTTIGYVDGPSRRIRVALVGIPIELGNLSDLQAILTVFDSVIAASEFDC